MGHKNGEKTMAKQQMCDSPTQPTKKRAASNPSIPKEKVGAAK